MSKHILFNDLKKGHFLEVKKLIESGNVDFPIVHKSIGHDSFYFFVKGMKAGGLLNSTTHNVKLVEAIVFIFNKFLEENLNYKFQDKNGNNALMLLAAKRDNVLFPMLLDCGFDFYKENKNGDDVFIIAAKSGNIEAMQKLVYNGYKISPIMAEKCLLLKNESILNQLIKSDYPFSSDTLFFLQHQREYFIYQTSLLSFYQRKNISFFAQDSKGNTPLHYVLENKNYKLINYFPITDKIWLTVNNEGKTCYDILKEKGLCITKEEYKKGLEILVEKNTLNSFIKSSVSSNGAFKI